MLSFYLVIKFRGSFKKEKLNKIWGGVCWGWGGGEGGGGKVTGENKKMYITAAATIKISEDKLDFCRLRNTGFCTPCL